MMRARIWQELHVKAPASGVTRWLQVSVFAVLTVLLTASGEARAVRRVVVLQSFERGNVVLDQFTSMLRVLIDEGSHEPVTFNEFVVNPPGFRATPEQAIIDYVRSAFTGEPKPDLVVTTGGPAAAFARKYRSSLFPESATLYAAVDQRFLKNARLSDLETAVAVANSPTVVIKDILQLFPDTHTVFVIMGSGELGRFWRQEFAREVEAFQDRLRFMWSDGLSYAEMLQRASELPPRSAILCVSVDVDSQGATYPTQRVLTDLRVKANAPVFGAQSAELGFGLIGGHLMSIEQVSRTSADAALRILSGTSPSLITSPIQQPGAPTYDWRELRRWGVREDRLPAGSTVLFRQPGVWDRFKWVIIASASVLIVQTVLIAALLVSRTKKQRAEQSLRESEGRFRRGLIQAQEEERSRVARELHDDVCQRMVLLAMELQRFGRTLPDGAVEPRQQVKDLCEQVRTLGHDVNGISHRLHSSKLGVLGLPAAAGTFCEEIALNQKVAVEFVHKNVPAQLPDEVGISLFRVLQEALANATKHSGASTYHVSLEGTSDGLHLEVVDDGCGFDVAAAMASSGLGLVSMQERLRLVGGEVSFESIPGEGTKVRAWTPWRPEAADPKLRSVPA
jgi:signal transduction histidine kinase